MWVPNGVDLSAVGAVHPSAPKGMLTILYAGAHGVANGLDTVLDAAAYPQGDGLAPRARFRLVGEGPEKARLQDRVLRESLKMVDFDPPVPNGAIYGLMQEADAFLMILRDSPVFRFGVSPNKLFDYLASARPVLFGVATPYNPLAEANAGYTFFPDCPDRLVAAVKQLLAATPEERQAMGWRGRRYVEENHDMDRLANRLEQTLLTLVGSKTHGDKDKDHHALVR